MIELARPRPPAVDFGADSFQGVSVPMFLVFRANVEAGRGWVVRGVSFDDCTIEGPAVLMPVESCTFDGCDLGFNKGDIRNLLLRPEGESVTGAIALAACSFTRCHFNGVGFTGHASFLNQLKQFAVKGQDPRGTGQ